MTPPLPLRHDFEGKPIDTFRWKDRPAWIARQIGGLMEYAGGGGRLVSKIAGEWSAHIVPDRDFTVLVGPDLADFQDHARRGPCKLAPRTAHIMLLFEPGLRLVLARTDKPTGDRLGRFIDDVVLPDWFRAAPRAAPPSPDEQPVDEEDERPDEEHAADVSDDDPEGTPAISPTLALWAYREHRLARHDLVTLYRLDIMDRQFRAQSLRTLGRQLHRLGRIGKTGLAHCEMAAAEVAMGDVLHLPTEKAPRGWLTYGEAARRLGVSYVTLMLAAFELCLRGVRPGLVKLVYRRARPYDGWVALHVLSPAAVERIRQHLGARDGEPRAA